jgi:hypothetical protein
MATVTDSDEKLLDFVKSRKPMADAARRHIGALHLRCSGVILGKEIARIGECRKTVASILSGLGAASASALVSMNVASFDDIVRQECAAGGHANLVLALSWLREATMALSAIASLHDDDSPEDNDLTEAFALYIGNAEKICKKMQEANAR